MSPPKHLRVVVEEESDERLLSRTARGDRAAFAALYDRYAARVHGLARRVVRDPTMSQDTTQEVMTELWRTAGRFDPGRGSAAGWILALAHRRSVDAVRREQSARDRVDRAGRRQGDRPFDEVAETIAVRADHDRVVTALDDLTDLQRQAIELAYFNGYTYREVATLLDVPLGTVKTRMRDGMIRLRDALGVPT